MIQRPSDSIARKLKELREARNLTIKETAKLIGVPESTYREWEYGRAIRGEPYLKIATAFDISLDELLNPAKSRHNGEEKELEEIINDLTKINARLTNLKDKLFSIILISLFSIERATNYILLNYI